MKRGQRLNNFIRFDPNVNSVLHLASKAGMPGQRARRNAAGLWGSFEGQTKAFGLPGSASSLRGALYLGCTVLRWSNRCHDPVEPHVLRVTCLGSAQGVACAWGSREGRDLRGEPPPERTKSPKTCKELLKNDSGNGRRDTQRSLGAIFPPENIDNDVDAVLLEEVVPGAEVWFHEGCDALKDRQDGVCDGRLGVRLGKRGISSWGAERDRRLCLK